MDDLASSFTAGAADVGCDSNQSVSLFPFVEDDKVLVVVGEVGVECSWWIWETSLESAFCDSMPRTRAHS